MEPPYPNLVWKTTSIAGLRLAFLEHREDGSVRVLIEMGPGAAYPPHRHRGVEEVFVIRGGYRDAEGSYPAGSFLRYAEGTAHAPSAGPEGCLLLAWAERGVDLLLDGGGG